jgi:protein SCO1/2
MKCFTVLRVAAAAGLLIVGVSCRREAGQGQSAPAARPTASNAVVSTGAVAAVSATSTNERFFLVKGVVREIFPEKKQIRIAHEAIPDYMDAMTMAFEVKDAKELTKASPGDSIRFRMIVTETDGWIDNIMKLEPSEGQVAAPETPARETFRQVREVEQLKVGEVMPEYRFTNQVGQSVGLHDFKGQALAFSFVYTRCPFPTFCPRITGNMAAAQQKLKALENAPTNWHFLAITIDPEYDTPAVLASYAKKYGADPARWSFLTGPLIDITAIAEQFGLMFWRADPTKPLNIDHNLRTVVIGADGRVKNIMIENEWKVDELVAAVVDAAKN